MKSILSTQNILGSRHYFGVPEQIASLFVSAPELSTKEKTVTVSARLHLVGTRYQFDTATDLYDYIDNCLGELVVMASEPDNAKDPDAIAVYGTGLEGKTQRIAYISRSETPKAHAIIAQSGMTYAVLRIDSVPQHGHTTLTAYPYSKKSGMIRTIKMSVPEHPRSDVQIIGKAETSATVLELVKYAAGNCDEAHKQSLAQIIFQACADNPLSYKRAARYIIDMKRQPASQPSTYHQANPATDSLDSAISRIARYIDSHRSTMSWSMVYYFMRRKKIIDRDMTANQFGVFIESHGGPSAQKVRKSGDYQLSSAQLARLSCEIESLNAFFTDY